MVLLLKVYPFDLMAFAVAVIINAWHFCLSSEYVSALRGKNLLLFEQILFFKSRLNFEKAISSTAASRKLQSLLPFYKYSDRT